MDGHIVSRGRQNPDDPHMRPLYDGEILPLFQPYPRNGWIALLPQVAILWLLVAAIEFLVASYYFYFERICGPFGYPANFYGGMFIGAALLGAFATWDLHNQWYEADVWKAYKLNGNPELDRLAVGRTQKRLRKKPLKLDLSLEQVIGYLAREEKGLIDDSQVAHTVVQAYRSCCKRDE